MGEPTVCVIGGGTAGLEGLLAAREVLGPAADLRLIAPEREFRYRPMSAAALFRPAPERSLRVVDVVTSAGATWIADRAAFVDDAQRTVLTRDGETVEFDFALLAAGARLTRTLQHGHLWARGADPGFLDEILAQLRAGGVRSVAVVIPRGARWPIPAYELALVLAWSSADTGATITLITAESQPLDALGSAATDAVVRELAAAGVHVIAGVEVRDSRGPAGDMRVTIAPESHADATAALLGKPSDPARTDTPNGSDLHFDRLISLPTISGPGIAGLTTDAVGFVEVDEGLRLCGSQRMWAAGACVSAALEHGALAAQQADAAVAAIAAASGAAASVPRAPDLTGMLLTGQRDRWLAENPPGTREPSTRCLWWPPGRAVGQMLAHHITAVDPSTAQSLPSCPGGLAISAPVALGCSQQHVRAPAAPITDELRRARQLDIDNRQLMAVRRRERETEAEIRSLSVRLDALAVHQQQTIHELQRHGYLRGRANT